MPKYSRSVRIPGKSSQELYDCVSRDIDKFMGKAPSQFKFEIERDPIKKEVQLKSSMATATLHCQEEELVLDSKLSLVAMPFRGKIDEGINRWLSKTFGIDVGSGS